MKSKPETWRSLFRSGVVAALLAAFLIRRNIGAEISLVFPLTSIAPVYLLLAAAGLFWMLWHLLIARIMWNYAKD